MKMHHQKRFPLYLTLEGPFHLSNSSLRERALNVERASDDVKQTLTPPIAWSFATIRAKALEPSCSRTVPEVGSSCRLLKVPLFRGSSRFESLILSHHSRFTRECNKEEINDDDDECVAPVWVARSQRGWTFENTSGRFY